MGSSNPFISICFSVFQWLKPGFVQSFQAGDVYDAKRRKTQTPICSRKKTGKYSVLRRKTGTLCGMKKRLLKWLMILPCLLLTGAARVQLPEVRAVWVTRFDYRSPADVDAILANCARAGFTDVFFQIRGNGTVSYPSRIEPWAFELSGRDVSATGRNPGWDPLARAVAAARQNRIRLHAYINVLPGWRGREDPPPAAGQLWTAHPDWFMVDSTGLRMRATSRWYTFLNPAHPAVRRHLTALAAELAQYDLAGLHLDYIRFPYDYKDVARELFPGASPDQLKAHADFSYDAVSAARARALYGKNVSPKEWDSFRRLAVTETVRSLKKTFKGRRGPQAVISASVLADFTDGYQVAFQESRRWTKERAVDWVVPMNYNARLFDERLERIRHSLGRRASAEQLVVGIDCKADPQEIRRQVASVRAAGCRGVALFAYSYLFENHRPTEKGRMISSL
jgi:uncharacterized lipoprotein YddW (UPF0748 family)